MAEIGQPAGQQFYCIVKIRNSQLNASNINYLIIREWVFNILPTLELQFYDSGYLTEISPLEDGEDIEVTISKNEDSDEIISLVFSFDDMEMGLIGDNRKTIITLTGHLKVDYNMFTLQTRSFARQTSKSVLQQIATESGIEFTNPRNIKPSDNMTWFQSNSSNFDFIKHVIKRAYIPKDVIFLYGDTRNKFVFTSLLAEMGKKESKITKFSVENTESSVRNENDKDNTIWFASYDIVNYSGFYNKKSSYGVSYTYYDLKDNAVTESYTDINKLTDLSFRNRKGVSKNGVYIDYVGDYFDNNIYGYQYFESKIRNPMLKNNFFANSLNINVNSLSKVYLFDTIEIQIPSLFGEGEVNEPLSGEYLVGGIQHEISQGNIYRKKVSIHRNGMNKNSNYKLYEVE